jgi:hypothetical protein
MSRKAIDLLRKFKIDGKPIIQQGKFLWFGKDKIPLT